MNNTLGKSIKNKRESIRFGEMIKNENNQENDFSQLKI